MMRGLFVQRQIDVMVRLGYRTDAFNDRLPVLSLVVAVENIPIGGSGEDSVAAVPSIHRHAFDVGPDMIGQTPASMSQVLPPSRLRAMRASAVCSFLQVPGPVLAPATNSKFGSLGWTKNGST